MDQEFWDDYDDYTTEECLATVQGFFDSKLKQFGDGKAIEDETEEEGYRTEQNHVAGTIEITYHEKIALEFLLINARELLQEKLAQKERMQKVNEEKQKNLKMDAKSIANRERVKRFREKKKAD